MSKSPAQEKPSGLADTESGLFYCLADTNADGSGTGTETSAFFFSLNKPSLGHCTRGIRGKRNEFYRDNGETTASFGEIPDNGTNH
jgi:hypothetical protein